ncbi:MAG TPA: patatin-like phospholipase family protein [Gammaproteobacteria bacterium]|nr:patatin-like phospholipase family protein [Gammaproteobacteria bacterium]
MPKNSLPSAKFDEVVYLLQGGGALGAFQVGAYQALDEDGYAPDWIVGISIGSINAAIIAGNPHKVRMEKLYQFWNAITHKIDPRWTLSGSHDHNLIQAYNLCSSLGTLSFGQQNFFNVRGINPWLIKHATPDQISFYDTSVLKETLAEVVDFTYLNKAHIRLSLGAVNVQSGKLTFFDNTKQKLTAAHIMASCALPPGFPAVKIGKEYYWDGGLYSNTPLICVINDLPHKNRLCFLVDLFDSTGLLPKTLDDVLERAKDINYAGHLDIMLDYYDLHLLLQTQIATCIDHLPDAVKSNKYIKQLAKLGDAHNVHITKIVYKANPHDLHSKDYEFSNFSAKRRFVDGYMHTKKLLADPDWWKTSERNIGNLVHNSTKDMNIVVGSCQRKKSQD